MPAISRRHVAVSLQVLGVGAVAIAVGGLVAPLAGLLIAGLGAVAFGTLLDR